MKEITSFQKLQDLRVLNYLSGKFNLDAPVKEPSSFEYNLGYRKLAWLFRADHEKVADKFLSTTYSVMQSIK